MQDDNYLASEHTPWSRRIRAVPKRTYSGKIVYDRPPHSFTLKDGIRVFRKAAESHPPETLPEFYKVLSLLPFIFATLWDGALGFFGIRPILAPYLEVIQGFFFNVLDSVSQYSYDEAKATAAKLIGEIAQRVGLEVKIKF